MLICNNPPQNSSLILDFNCQPLRRVPFCFMSVGPYGPGGVLSHFEGGGSPKCILGKTHPTASLGCNRVSNGKTHRCMAKVIYHGKSHGIWVLPYNGLSHGSMVKPMDIMKRYIHGFTHEFIHLMISAYPFFSSTGKRMHISALQSSLNYKGHSLPA